MSRRGSINHVSVTVSNLDQAMAFFRPWLDFLGYNDHEFMEDAGTRLVISINPELQTAFNIWEAKGELANHRFEVYEPGLHHLAMNAASRSEVDEMAYLVERLGGNILDGPGEFPYDPEGYYAVYFTGPDGLKLEFVHMPALAAANE